MGYAVAIAVVLPWITMIGTTEVATDRTAARAMPTTLAIAGEAPCTIKSRDPCHRNQRISTVAEARPPDDHASATVTAADLHPKVK